MTVAMDIVLVLAGLALVLVGLAGCFLPVLPGPPVAFLGLLLLRFTSFVSVARSGPFDRVLWVLGGVAVAVTVVDNIVPVWGARTFGASRHGLVGASLGLLIGLFFVPAGLILGPFLGAVAGELLSGKTRQASLQAGVGSLLGFLGGVAMKFAVTLAMAVIFVRELLIRFSL